jgi:hypothetical protein
MYSLGMSQTGAAALIAARLILPVLYGLDEIPEQVRARSSHVSGAPGRTL